jgi:FKBP-type peptidyl-prolyl cis-trans isomerase
MNKFKFYFILLITTVSLFSCSKNDSAPVEPPRPYADQYTTDKTDIDSYIDTHYIFSVDSDYTISFGSLSKTGTIVTSTTSDVITGEKTDFIGELLVGDDLYMSDGITKIGTILEIISSTSIKLTSNALSTNDKITFSVKKETIRNQTTYPLKSKEVNLDSVKYTVYYLVLREGVGQSPCNVDGVLTSYRGDYLSRDATTKLVSAFKFEEVKYPQTMYSLYEVITGWSEIFPLFKTGTSDINANGTVTHKDFGAGVMFIPSGLAYYNTGKGSIPAYSPLVFSFKLYEIQRLDQDKDGIPSYLEDYNGDGFMRVLATGVDNPDDFPDKDGIPNFLDVDDDGDNYTTKLETQYINPLDPNKVTRYYPYDGVLVDDPATLFVDERQGIPRKFTGPLLNPSAPESSTNVPTPQPSDYTDPLRLRIHLDKEHHPTKP